VDELYWSLVSLMEAQRDLDTHHEETKGDSWDPHAHRYETAIQNAKDRFHKAFRDAVLEITKPQGG